METLVEQGVEFLKTVKQNKSKYILGTIKKVVIAAGNTFKNSYSLYIIAR